MNLGPVYRMLRIEDYKKVLRTARNRRDWFLLHQVWIDPGFEYHVDLPPENPAARESMETWLHNEEHFE